ncbi:hypothetical protein [Opitutus sp. ER46]|uniref:hypothetical protein n=1 Tax=Opitutus sp. ER46 TaxID=2161864 RepID=UPI0011B1FB40|nr:hypothetical protein [Opitutus sp. ER46]
MSDVSGRQPWRYLAAPGVEILGRCDDAIMCELVEREHRQNERMRVLLPEELRFRSDEPKTVILVDAQLAPKLARGFVEQLGDVAAGLAETRDTAVARRPPAAAGLEALLASLNARLLPNLVLDAEDHFVTYALVERGPAAGRFFFTREHWRQAMTRRTPALPPWFVEGWMQLLDGLSGDDDAFELRPMTWLSLEDTARLQRDPDAPRGLLPLAEFFTAKPKTLTEAGRRLWLDQAELLLRWGLDEPKRREALWRFVAAAARNGVSDALCQESFGMGYARLQERLGEFVEAATSRACVLRFPTLARVPKSEVRDATPAEINRLKGEWERLALGYVRARYPGYDKPYEAAVRETVGRGLDRAPQDAAVLGLAGLLEIDLGRTEAARALLTRAVDAGATRALVRVRLAALRLAEARREAGRDGEVATAEVAELEHVLAPTWQRQPALASGYAVLAEAWYRGGGPLTPVARERLQEGLACFPEHLSLLFFAARLEARSGDAHEAEELAERGLATATTPAAQQRFRDLIAALKRSP